MSGFDTAFDRVIGHEGGFQDKSSDRGNWTSGIVGQGIKKGTKFGISAMSYPHLDIKNLTVGEAREIYQRDFWQKYRCDDYHWSIGFQMFDAAVNHGPGNAARFLQRAVDVADDGAIGPITVAAVNAMPVPKVLFRFLRHRQKFMIKLSTWADYGKGWMDRIANNMFFCSEDYDK